MDAAVDLHSMISGCLLHAGPVCGRSSFHLRNTLFPAELWDLQKQLFLCVYTLIMTLYNFVV